MARAKITSENVRSHDIWNEVVAEYYDYEDRPEWEERDDGTLTARMKQDCLEDLMAEYDYVAPAEDDESVSEESAVASESAEGNSTNEEDRLGALLDGTVDEVEAALVSGEYDDHLSQMEGREADGDNRTGVHEAIQSRREQLTEDANAAEE